MNKPFTRYCAAAFCVIAMSTTSCVDDDYDLSEDIDLTVNLGGQMITLPGSSTADITLAQILDLDRNSSIKKVEHEGDYGLSVGDYVILQDGKSKPAKFEINRVTISNHPSSSASTTLPEFINLGGGARVTEQATPTINAINLSDDNVDRQLVRLDEARMAVDIEFSVAYTSSTGFDGTAYIDRGYTAEFDPSWTIEIVDAATLDFLRLTSHNTVEFTRDVAVTPTSPMVAKIRLVEIDFSKVDDGQGLYARGHFRLHSSVQSSGTISLYFDASQPVGASETLTLITGTKVDRAFINGVTGVVDPDINVDDTSFEITEIPDFLSDKDNQLVLDNPRINFVVSNNSPLTLNVNGYLSSYLDGAQTAQIKLGHFADGSGTSAITVPANSQTTFIVSRRPVQDAGAVNIVVDNLDEILVTVPDEILFHDIDVTAEPIPVSFTLGDEYTFDASYDAVIPLAFGSDMKLHYTHEDTGWDEDLEDYNFDRVQITLTAINSIPLDMTPTVTPLNKANKPMSTIDVDVTGSVAPGTMASHSTTELKIELRSTGTSIKELDGIALVFDATSNAQVEGINLNAGQAVRFENIKVTILGGITVDLNDKD